MSSPVKILLVALYPQQYPSVGESLGLSQIAGSIWSRFSSSISYFKVMDMVIYGHQMTAEYMEEVMTNRPDIICFSINYGTYVYFSQLLEETRRLPIEQDTLYILGGPLPTYRPDNFLGKRDPRIVVVRGEGDEAVRGIISAYLKHASLSQISNISYYADGKVHSTPRKVVEVEAITYPSYRRHHQSNTSTYPMYVERSRGCNWAQCTFCLRGLLDTKGTSSEYRLFRNERIFAELSQIRDVGKHIVTFADEDFLTGDVELDTHFLVELLKYKSTEFANMSIIFSTSVRKLFSREWTEDRCRQVRDVLQLLKEIGTERLFIGVESGSPTQLKRFNKAHSVEDARNAIRMLNEMQICYEVGFIMFDPLCSLREIQENVAFIVENNMLQNISAFDNALRLQKGSRYFRLANDKGMYCSSEPDEETLIYNYRFLDPDVQQLHNSIRGVQTSYEMLYYPLKSYSRASYSESLGENVALLRRCLINLRQLYLEYFVNVMELLCAGKGNSANEDLFVCGMKKIAKDIQKNMRKGKQSASLLYLDETILSVCNKLLADT